MEKLKKDYILSQLIKIIKVNIEMSLVFPQDICLRRTHAFLTNKDSEPDLKTNLFIILSLKLILLPSKKIRRLR